MKRVDAVVVVVGLGEDRLGMDVHEPARQVVLRRKLGKQGRALYPVRLSALFPLAIVRGHLTHGAAIRRVVLIGTLFRSEQADQFTASEVIRLGEREETLALVVCVYDGRAMLHSVYQHLHLFGVDGVEDHEPDISRSAVRGGE